MQALRALPPRTRANQMRANNKPNNNNQTESHHAFMEKNEAETLLENSEIIIYIIKS